MDKCDTICLKLFDRDILGRFFSFPKLPSSVDDKIWASPYIWVSGDNNGLLLNTAKGQAFCLLAVFLSVLFRKFFLHSKQNSIITIPLVYLQI